MQTKIAMHTKLNENLNSTLKKGHVRGRERDSWRDEKGRETLVPLNPLSTSLNISLQEYGEQRFKQLGVG